MPGASLPINGASRAVDYPVKKERPGYEWGPRWGADGSSSPAFAWGQTLLVSGEEIVSALSTQAKSVPPKTRDEFKSARSIFFSFCDMRRLKVSKSATFPRE